jgi:hypothetical protein
MALDEIAPPVDAPEREESNLAESPAAGSRRGGRRIGMLAGLALIGCALAVHVLGVKIALMIAGGIVAFVLLSLVIWRLPHIRKHFARPPGSGRRTSRRQVKRLGGLLSRGGRSGRRSGGSGLHLPRSRKSTGTGSKGSGRKLGIGRSRKSGTGTGGQKRGLLGRRSGTGSRPGSGRKLGLLGRSRKSTGTGSSRRGGLFGRSGRPGGQRRSGILGRSRSGGRNAAGSRRGLFRRGGASARGSGGAGKGTAPRRGLLGRFRRSAAAGKAARSGPAKKSAAAPAPRRGLRRLIPAALRSRQHKRQAAKPAGRAGRKASSTAGKAAAGTAPKRTGFFGRARRRVRALRRLRRMRKAGTPVMAKRQVPVGRMDVHHYHHGAEPFGGPEPPVPDPGGEMVPPPVAHQEEKNMGHLDGAIEAIHDSIGNFHPENVDELQAWFQELPEVFTELGSALETASGRFADEYPIANAVSDHMSELAGTTSGLSDHAGATYEVFRQAHEADLQRIEEPRPNEEFMDASNNR